MHVFYRDNGIDYLKETISVPGIARKMMFQQSKDALFLLCGKKDQDLYKTVKKISLVELPLYFVDIIK